MASCSTEASLDESSLTGESLSVTWRTGDDLLVVYSMAVWRS